MAATDRNNSFEALAPNFAYRLTLTLAECQRQGMPVFLFEGFRSNERQKFLFAQGRTRPGGRVTNAQNSLYSWHGYGLAADIVFIRGVWEWYWPAGDSPIWDKLAAIAERYGLASGARWNMDDNPHLQPANLRRSPSDLARELFASGGRLAVWRETRHDRILLING